MPGQIFFTHVMKTGGTSLTDVLRSAVPPSLAYPLEEGGPARVTAKTFSKVLLDMDPVDRARFRLFSVHQPAWVAWAAAPDAVKVTLLREPVARTVSHLRQLARSRSVPTDDPEEIYADERWRVRLVNYQTQIFADTADRSVPAAARLRGDQLDENDLVELRAELSRAWETAISHPLEVGETELTRAIDALDRYDAVGVTDDLPGITARVAALTGLDLPAVPRANVTDVRTKVSSGLLERIAADNEHDRRLYEHACRLAGVAPGSA